MFDFINPTILARLTLMFMIFNVLVLASAFMVWMERKVCAYIQDRSGPNRVGFEGALQPFADVIKLVFKEDLRPKAASARSATTKSFKRVSACVATSKFSG